MQSWLDATLHWWNRKKDKPLLEKLWPVKNGPWLSMDLAWLWVKTQVTWILWLESNPLLNVFWKAKNWNIMARDWENSKIMRNHLKWIPLVPWVVQKWLLLELTWKSDYVKKWIEWVKTVFEKPILPWNIVVLWEDWVSLCNEKWEANVRIEPTNYRWEFQELYEELDEQLTPWNELDKYLLQTWEFRFVTWFSWISNEDKWNPQVWDIFQGYYEVPTNFAFSEDWNIPFYLIEEFAAQIWSFWFWESLNTHDENWKVVEEKRKILTFNSSTCQYTWLQLKTWESFKLVWRIKTIEKRTASFEYVWYNSEWLEVIKWEITGNIVPLKILTRYLK